MTDHDYPFILNPTWYSILEPIKRTTHERAKAWVKDLLVPYLENNLHQFGVEIHVNNLNVNMGEGQIEVNQLGSPSFRDYHRMVRDDPMIEIEGSVVWVKDQVRNKNAVARLVSDDTITDCHIDHEHNGMFFARQYPMGWLENPEIARHDPIATTRVLSTNYRLSARLNYEHRRHLAIALERSKRVFLFTMQEELTSVRDWIMQGGARIPLTVTKLPWMEAVRLAQRWHDDEDKKRQKKKLKDTPPGTRQHVGKMRVDIWADKHVEDYDIYWCKDEQSLKHESVLQHHCVDGYWPYVQERRSVILHVRNADPKKDTDRWTVELRAILLEHNGDTRLMTVQFQGIQNRPAPSELKTIFNTLGYNRDENTPKNEHHWLDYKLLLEQLNTTNAKPLDLRRLR